MGQNASERQWLGKGLAFPLTLTDDVAGSDLAGAAFEESIRQSILIILGTAKGERVMRPDFGCGIYDLVFEPGTASTAGKVSQVVQEALLLFEPRIDVLDVRVESRFDQEDVAPDSDGIHAFVPKLLIHIVYEIRATNNVFNLVYPFYLERSPG